MTEIERKILGISESEILRKIASLKPAPKKIFDGLIKVFYFDFPDGRIKKAGDLMRVRVMRPKAVSRGKLAKKPFTEVVYKINLGVKDGNKVHEELEFEVKGDVSRKMAKNLAELGLKPTLCYEKKRKTFAWKKVKFELDTHPAVPFFMEIEAQSGAEIEKTIKALGLQKAEQTADSISALIKRKYPDVSLNGMTFN